MPVEDTAETMVRKPNINTLISVYREARSVFDSITKGKDTENLNYNWTGQHTDIAFADDRGAINASQIDKISDLDLKQNVYQSYNAAVKDGYLQYSTETRDFTLTEAGREHINSDAFKEQFEKDQSRMISQDKLQIELNGNSSDLNAFRYTNSIDLNHLSYSDPAQFKRVQDYFYRCEDYDFVKINDGIVTATDKCKEYLAQNSETNFAVHKVTADTVSEFANKAASEAAKKATSQASAKTATAAGRSAASMGVGAAVTVVVDTAKTGYKKITDNKPTPKIQNRR